ncbi:Cache 3/Cache 2 fusion domain-containing protein [Clostridium lacusfryxellense]|uniref:Cache 3/Cache 2 fusion domain-containing protein n=1 Tax=Clostridium lacusfryxellense TaxID=205328 RepID=UPI001C0B406E|nr:Cache 3/Cache 2 fusion domain-containing protein [Clostridium lacusfryxellense]MBU3109994.1 Cache 3/Cache 2 fusion domain-containing protein [Clostridium lacusfryxellense]
MSIKIKLIISYLILIILSVSFLGILIGNISKDAVFKEVKEKSKSVTELINTTISVRNNSIIEKSYSDLNSATKLLYSLGNITVANTQNIRVGSYDLPALYAGSQKLSLDTKIVDAIHESTGTNASIFLLANNKLIRVSTTHTKNGKRIEGTYYSSDSQVYKKIINNQEFLGITSIGEENSLSRYKPLINKNKKVIGAIGVGNTLLNDYLEKTLKDIKIGKTGYVYIIDSNGNMILHPDEKGKNVSQYDYTKKIISSKNGLIEYTHKGVHKLGYFMYFKSWDWYIVTTANYDDLASSSESILYTTLLSGLLMILLSAIIAVFLADNLVKPINKLKSYMEKAGKGDLTVHSDINNKDEIGVLSDSFNNMLTENRQLIEELVQYDKLKTEFIANMSHELKTPLNIIFSTAQLFSVYLSRDLNSINVEKLTEYTNYMKQNCYRLLRLVNNIIDISKIDSNFMELNLKNQNIVQVAEEIALSTIPYAEGISRTIIFDTDIEEKIMAFDDEKLERILLNLISNATKFTRPRDTIEIGVYDKDNHIIISVKDNGIGIPEDKLSQIFERFKQVDPLLSRAHEGSGIGLAIVKSLVEMHGGTISVKSKYQEGTEFTISLPVTLTSDNDNQNPKIGLMNRTNSEKIQIEFSDIYE